jgi:hypothetical protein
MLAKPAGLGSFFSKSLNVGISRKEETRSKTEGCKWSFQLVQEAFVVYVHVRDISITSIFVGLAFFFLSVQCAGYLSIFLCLFLRMVSR